MAHWWSELSLETQGALYSTLLLLVVIGCHRVCKFIRRRKGRGTEGEKEEVQVLQQKTIEKAGVHHSLTPQFGSKYQEKMSFAEFQLRYLIVYAVAFVADYIGAAYVYSMFSDYLDLPASTVLHLMQIPYMGTALATLVISPLIDAHGRRLGFAAAMLLFCGRYFVVVFCPLYDPLATPDGRPTLLVYSLCITSQIMYGISLALLYSVPECWMVAEHSRRGYPVEYLTSTYSRSYFINAILGILGVQGARCFRDWSGLEHRKALGVVLSAGGIICAIDVVLTYALWTENTGRADGGAREDTQVESCHQQKVWWQQLPDIPRLLVYAAICIFSSFQIFAIGLGHCLQEAGSWIFVGIWTPVLETKEYENVLTSQLLLQGLGSYAVRFVCRGDDTVASVLGLPADPPVGALVEAGAIEKKKKKGKGLSIRSTILAYHVVLLAGLAACAVAPTKPLFLAANLASTFGYGFYLSAYGNLKALVVPKEGRVVIVSLFALPAAFITYFGSYFFDASKPQPMYWLAALYQAVSFVMLILSGIAVWMRKRKMRKLAADGGETLPLWHPKNSSVATE